MQIREQIFYNHHLGITVPAGWECLQNHPEKDSLPLDKCGLRREEEEGKGEEEQGEEGGGGRGRRSREKGEREKKGREFEFLPTFLNVITVVNPLKAKPDSCPEVH